MSPKHTRRKLSRASPIEISDSDDDTNIPPSSKPPSPTKSSASATASSPAKSQPYKKKRQTRLKFTRGNGIKSSPPKPSAGSSQPVKRSLSYRESSEVVSTDASDPNEVVFEEPVAKSGTSLAGSSPLRRRGSRIIVDSDSNSDGEIEVKSETESEEEVAPRKRVVRRFAGSDDEEVGPSTSVRGRGAGARRIVSGKVEAKKERGVRGEESDDEEIVSTKRAGKRKAIALSLTPTSEDEENITRKRGGRVIRRKEKPEKEESEEEDILDGLNEDVVLDSRLRSAPQRNSKKMEMRETLAKLRRKKLGRDTPPPVNIEDSPDSSEEIEENVIRPRGRRVVKPIPGARPSHPTLQDWLASGGSEAEAVKSTTATRKQRNKQLGTDSGASDDNDSGSEKDSWIESDGEEAANAVILPEGYSMRGHQSLAHHFKVVMQMFVHLACLKPRKRWDFRVDEKNDQYFGLSLRALRRKLDGLRDSLVTSSVWTAAFKEVLNTHPELTIFDLEFAVSGCGACRISSRMSTFRGSLDGEDYDRDTFQPVAKKEESVDSDAGEENERATSFDLGRFCKTRVRCYHNFVHWEWQLFQNINDEIEVLRTAGLRNDPARVQRPAPDDPDGIMGWLDGRGIVQQVVCLVVKCERLLTWLLGMDSARASHGGGAWIGVSEGSRG
ncbi:hypothetical protein BDV93DRAFT_986 [Ceratobasidium sp. AG-I]|nr:hypothetical protein BDV93DRAFT_986 [Ceratobasidium sp. AG-I]